MSWQAVDAVMDHSRTRGGTREVLTAIATHADAKGSGARPSVETLARRTNKSERQVVRIIQTLESQFADEVRIERGHGRGNPHTYTILLPLCPKEKVTSWVRKGDIPGEPNSLKGDISEQEKVTFGEIKGDICEIPYIENGRVGEPSENQEEGTKKEKNPPNPQMGDVPNFSDDFLEIWSVYPEVGRLRGSKSEAFAAWRKLSAAKKQSSRSALNNALHFPDFCTRFAPAVHRWLKGKWEPYAEVSGPAEASRGSPRSESVASGQSALGSASARRAERFAAIRENRHER